ncbi:MAG: PilZ domain-containing protein [Acidobacteriia bacterium]|nr:PilZ domain-containing protein [Terriglobia bacterium]
MARKRARSDQRKWQRIPLAIPVFIRGTAEDGKEFLEFATALNISAGGALVATRRQLPRCVRLSLEIPVAPVPRAISLPKSVRRMRAKLVRVTMGESYQLWGLKFANILNPPKRSKVGLRKRKIPSYV